MLYFKATVETKSSAPNLDLFPVHCWSSKKADPNSADGKITLIKDGEAHIFTLLKFICFTIQDADYILIKKKFILARNDQVTRLSLLLTFAKSDLGNVLVVE